MLGDSPRGAIECKTANVPGADGPPLSMGKIYVYVERPSHNQSIQNRGRRDLVCNSFYFIIDDVRGIPSCKIMVCNSIHTHLETGTI